MKAPFQQQFPRKTFCKSCDSFLLPAFPSALVDYQSCGWPLIVLRGLTILVRDCNAGCRDLHARVSHAHHVTLPGTWAQKINSKKKNKAWFSSPVTLWPLYRTCQSVEDLSDRRRRFAVHMEPTGYWLVTKLRVGTWLAAWAVFCCWQLGPALYNWKIFLINIKQERGRNSNFKSSTF